MEPAGDYWDILTLPYWRHRIKLDEGRYTPGTRDASLWDTCGLPEDMSGKTFLDVGAWDGLHCFEAERRGAEKVLATDVWDEPTDSSDWWNSLRTGEKRF